MKKINYTLCSLFIFLFFASSCENKVDNYQNENNIKRIQRIEQANATNSLTLTPPDDSVAIVLNEKGDTIAVTGDTVTIKIPSGVKLKNANRSLKAESIKQDSIIPSTYFLSYISDSDIDTLIDTQFNSYQTLFIEDSKNADFDYNDLIVHVFVSKQTFQNTITFRVQGIALGASKKIALGFYTREKGEQIIFNNVKEDLFSKELLYKTDDNQKIPGGFINTQGNDGPELCHFDFHDSKTFKFENVTSETSFVFFIKATDKEGNISTIYAANTNAIENEEIINEMIDKNGYPYGILSNIDNGVLKLYPREKVNISEVYPNFFKWVTGDISGSFYDSVINKPEKDANKYINTSYRDQDDNYKSIWDYINTK